MGRQSIPHVLHYAETWGLGGIESSTLDIIRCLTAAGVRSTVFTAWKYDDALDQELSDAGAQLVACREGGSMLSAARRCAQGWSAFSKLLSGRHFDAVHLNAMNGMAFVYARIAKARGIPAVVVHSRNSRYGAGWKIPKAIAHRTASLIGGSAPSARLAVSRDAGRFLFGSRDFALCRRGLDSKRFAFDEGARTRLRNELGIAPQTFALGFVGRMVAEKNPLFAIRVFARLHCERPDSVLVMAGDGPMLEECRREIGRLSLEDSARCLGRVPDTAPLYSAFDALITPSSYEGLPNNVVEAQASGLAVLLSDAVSTEADVTGLVRFLPLSAGEPAWALELEGMACGNAAQRAGHDVTVAKAGFSQGALADVLAAAYGIGGSFASMTKKGCMRVRDRQHHL